MVLNVSDVKLKLIFRSFEKLKQKIPHAEIEISAILQNSHFIRLTRNVPIQAQIEENSRVSIRVIVDKKTGVAVTNRLSEESIIKAGDVAFEIAKNSVAREDAGLPDKPHHKHELKPFSEDLLNSKKKFVQIERWVEIAERTGCYLSGSFETNYYILMVLNNKGTESIYGAPKTSISFISERGGLSGYGSYLGERLQTDLAESQLEQSFSKCSFQQEPKKLVPGKYEVVLEPEAFAEILDKLSVFSFGARHYLEKRSFATDVLGKKIFPEFLSVYDDAKHPEQLEQPFDFEGVPKKKVPLIEKGTVKEVVYDTETGRIAEKKSTGHALPLPNPHGPVPSHLVVLPGDNDYGSLISKVAKGILVTRFFYTNVEDQKRGVITGMTRDGTFLIQNGEVTTPLMDLRFTQNAVEALKNIVAIGNDIRLVQPFYAQIATPTVLISEFNFTGTKEG